MKNKLIFAVFTALFMTLPSVAQADQSLVAYDVIVIDDAYYFKDKEIDLKRDDIVDLAYLISKSQERSKNMSKKFGPLTLDFNLRPMRVRRSGIRFDINLMETLKILSSKPDFDALREAFKPDRRHNIISPETQEGIKLYFDKGLKILRGPLNTAQADIETESI